MLESPVEHSVVQSKFNLHVLHQVKFHPKQHVCASHCEGPGCVETSLAGRWVWRSIKPMATRNNCFVAWPMFYTSNTAQKYLKTDAWWPDANIQSNIIKYYIHYSCKKNYYKQYHLQPDRPNFFTPSTVSVAFLWDQDVRGETAVLHFLASTSLQRGDKKGQEVQQLQAQRRKTTQ